MENSNHRIESTKEIPQKNFCHLHTHTEYSLLDGSNKIKNYVKRVKELGMNSAAITDHGNMFGVVEFYKTAKEHDIKPIIGCEVYVAPEGTTMYDKASFGDERYNHLVLLAENNTGYQNLIKIVSLGYSEGFYYKPRVDFSVLEEYHEGLVCLSACLAGSVARSIIRGNKEKTEQIVTKYLTLFGKDRYYLELQDHGIPEQHIVNTELLRLHEKLGVSLVATNDCHYTYPEDAESHDVLLCIQTGKKINDTDRMRYEDGQYYVKSKEEMEKLFPYAKEAIYNTQKIADMCNVEFTFGDYKIPIYEVPQGYESAKEYLKAICEKGFEEKYVKPNQYSKEELNEIHKQIEYELGIIEEMGFIEYILIVWDYINWSKENDCWVGPGRGSAAGSRVCYCTGITNIDPVKYNLLFERFLNPERVSMPDIDVDFEYAERYRAIEYVTQKYGAKAVSQITTFGTMAARGVIKAVGKVLDYPYQQMDTLAKMIPMEPNMTIEKALTQNPEFQEIYNNDIQMHELIEMAKKLEGLPNHTSVHAAGVVIYPCDASKCVPLARSTEGNPTAQYNMVQLEELGYLKMDFLGLRTLTVIKDAVTNIKKDFGVDVDINHIDLNDKEVLDFIGTGKTEGVFQLESSGMQNFMKELKPQNFEDIIAGISLYRPGPMDFIPDYIKGKNNKENIEYATPLLKDILEPTYNCIVYQEQVIAIVQKLAGYTMGQADNIRRAMSKKKQYVIDEERRSFVYGDEKRNIKGCVNNGISEKVANEIYDSMVDFAKYAFNKSHGAAYAVISMQTTWLKYYYPVQYMSALMTSVMDNPSKLTGYMMAAKSQGIEILPPSIRHSKEKFTPENGKIRYALCGIKNISGKVAEMIVAYQNNEKSFMTLKDVVEKISQEANKKCLESLIKCGAMDGLGANRKQMMLTYEKIVDGAKSEKKNNVMGQMSLFDVVKEEAFGTEMITLPDVEEYSKKELLSFEKEVSGIFISGHPLNDYEKTIEKHATHNSSSFIRNEETGEINVCNDEEVGIGCIITNVKKIYTKNNSVMAFVSVEDLYGAFEVIVFPSQYEKYKNLLYEDNPILLKGKMSVEEEKVSVICEKIESLDEMPQRVWIKFKNIKDYEINKEKLNTYCNEHIGKDDIIIYIEDEKKQSKNTKCILATNKVISDLKAMFGEENIAIVC